MPISVQSIPPLSPPRPPRPFDCIYSGWLNKQGHYVMNWKTRYFVIKNCLFLYYKTDLSLSQGNETPLGVHIITSIKDNKTEDYGWIIETLDKKPFSIRASNEEQMINAIAAMKYAIQLYTTVYKSYEDYDAKIALGIALISSGYLDIGLNQLESIVQENNSDAEAYYHFASALMISTETMDAAISNFKKCLAIQPGHINARTNLGTALFMHGDIAEAHKVLTSVLSDVPTNVEAANNLCMLCVHRCAPGDWEFAESKIQYAIQCDKTRPSLYLTYSDLLIVMGKDDDDAIEVLEGALDMIPNRMECSSIYSRIGEIRISRGEIEAGIESFKEALDIDPRNLRAIHGLQKAVRLREEDQQQSAPVDFFEADDVARSTDPMVTSTSPSFVRREEDYKRSGNSPVHTSGANREIPGKTTVNRGGSFASQLFSGSSSGNNQGDNLDSQVKSRRRSLFF